MELYEKNLIINILEAKLLESFNEYCPQGQYNNKFIKYLYKYIRENTYSGEHDELLRQFVNLQLSNPLFSNTKIKENTDRKTYVLIDDSGISSTMLTEIAKIVKEYYNYNYNLISENKVEIKFNFGWLPQNTASWLNLINNECLVDYYIDGITLRPNTYSQLGHIKPDSGKMCYLIDSVNAYDTIMFLADKAKMDLNDFIPKIKIASLLTELRGSKGATLNRIVEFDIDNCFYELGPYNQNYLSTTYSALVIEVPWELATDEYFYLYDVSNSVTINNSNNADPNNQNNFFVAFDNENFNNLFTKFKLKNKDKLAEKIFENGKKLGTSLIQYLLGDFIWRTSDSKLIAYSQNLINALFTNAQLKPNGIWSDALSSLITRYKTNAEISLFDDDVIDKATEEAMLTEYNIVYGLDPNEELFSEW